MNRYNIKMKKSIWQFDQYLQNIYKEIVNVTKHNNDNNDTTTRHNTNHDTMISAWRIFSRPQDTEDLIDPLDINTDKGSTPGHDPSSNSTNPSSSIQQSSQLGQYFASPENSQLVVDCVFQTILPLLESSSPQPHILFIEPSCGYGDIIVALLKTLQVHRISPDCISIHGYDIDLNAIKVCQAT